MTDHEEKNGVNADPAQPAGGHECDGAAAANVSADGRAVSTSEHAGGASACDDACASAVEKHATKKKRRAKGGKAAASGKGGKKIALIVLGVILAVLLLSVAVAFALVKSGESSLKDFTGEILAAEDAQSADEGRMVEYKGKKYALNEDMVSVVFIGYDRNEVADPALKAGQADTVIVLALDTKTGKATAINVPRDSMVEVGEFAGDAYIGQDTMQLCLAFSYGDGAETSCENVTTSVSRTLYNMPMSYYVALNVAGIAPLNDAVGGIELNALQTIPGTDIVEGQTTLLMGDNAERYVRYRDTSALSSSSDRQQRQMQYITAYAAKALSGSDGESASLTDLYDLASEYSVTNLGASQFAYLASVMISHGITSLDSVTLSGETVEGSQYIEYQLGKDAVYQTVLDVYYTPIEEEDK
ncbi:MAG: LCP family protein [Eggerthellaceae bacterium]